MGCRIGQTTYHVLRFFKFLPSHNPWINRERGAGEQSAQLVLALPTVPHWVGNDEEEIQIAVRIVISPSP